MTQTFASCSARLGEFIRRSSARSRIDTPTTQADDVFNQLALSLFALQYRSVAPYRDLCDTQRATPKSVSHWTQIPAVPTQAFKEFELSSLSRGQRTHVFHSSGTTDQKPGRHFHNADSLATYEASLLPWFRIHLLADAPHEPGLIVLAPRRDEAPRSSLVHMFETIRLEFDWPLYQSVVGVDPDGTWVLDTKAVLQALNQATDAAVPVLLLGTAFSFVHLLDCLIERDIRFQLPAASRVMETGGYKGRSRALLQDQLHALITRQLGVPASHIICEYGMSELSSQAYDGIAGLATETTGRTFRFPPCARIRIISPETGVPVANGKIGLIQVFDLANVRSVTAVQTEDLGLRREDGFELVGRAQVAEPRGCSLMTA